MPDKELDLELPDDDWLPDKETDLELPDDDWLPDKETELELPDDNWLPEKEPEISEDNWLPDKEFENDKNGVEFFEEDWEPDKEPEISENFLLPNKDPEISNYTNTNDDKKSSGKESDQGDLNKSIGGNFGISEWDKEKAIKEALNENGNILLSQDNENINNEDIKMKENPLDKIIEQDYNKFPKEIEKDDVVNDDTKAIKGNQEACEDDNQNKTDEFDKNDRDSGNSDKQEKNKSKDNENLENDDVKNKTKNAEDNKELTDHGENKSHNNSETGNKELNDKDLFDLKEKDKVKEKSREKESNDNSDLTPENNEKLLPKDNCIDSNPKDNDPEWNYEKDRSKDRMYSEPLTPFEEKPKWDYLSVEYKFQFEFGSTPPSVGEYFYFDHNKGVIRNYSQPGDYNNKNAVIYDHGNIKWLEGEKAYSNNEFSPNGKQNHQNDYFKGLEQEEKTDYFREDLRNFKEMGLQGASKEEIKQEYYNLAKKYHPDLNKTDTQAAEKFQDISRAYNKLHDNLKDNLIEEVRKKERGKESEIEKEYNKKEEQDRNQNDAVKRKEREKEKFIRDAVKRDNNGFKKQVRTLEPAEYERIFHFHEIEKRLQEALIKEFIETISSKGDVKGFSELKEQLNQYKELDKKIQESYLNELRQAYLNSLITKDDDNQESKSIRTEKNTDIDDFVSRTAYANMKNLKDEKFRNNYDFKTIDKVKNTEKKENKVEKNTKDLDDIYKNHYEDYEKNQFFNEPNNILDKNNELNAEPERSYGTLNNQNLKETILAEKEVEGFRELKQKLMESLAKDKEVIQSIQQVNKHLDNYEANLKEVVKDKNIEYNKIGRNDPKGSQKENLEEKAKNMDKLKSTKQSQNGRNEKEKLSREINGDFISSTILKKESDFAVGKQSLENTLEKIIKNKKNETFNNQEFIKDIQDVKSKESLNKKYKMSGATVNKKIEYILGDFGVKNFTGAKEYLKNKNIEEIVKEIEIESKNANVSKKQNEILETPSENLAPDTKKKYTRITKEDLNNRKLKVSEYLDDLGENEVPMPLLQISKKFGITYRTLCRHVQNKHLAQYNKFWARDPDLINLREDTLRQDIINRINDNNNIEPFLKSKLLGIVEKQELTVKNFFRLIKLSVENILSVKINYRKLSAEYLTERNSETNRGNKWYANDRILDSLRFIDGYALPTASLGQMKRNLVEAFKEKSAYFECLIELYIFINPWSHKFTEQPKIIMDYFKSIDTIEKAYWFGFLLAEGHIRIYRGKNGESNTFFLSISALDLDHLIKFCKTIGFDCRKLNFMRSISKKGDTLRSFQCRFTNNEFCENLIKNGFPESGDTSENRELRFPYWIFSDKRFAMTMLLGFFDGDGSHHMKYANSHKKGDRYLTPAIKIKSRQCLEDIKTCFNIENDIRNRKGGYFELSIGTDFFNDLLLIYKESLGRKRHIYVYEIKFKITRDELKKSFDNGWSSREIADYHLSTYGIKISDGLAYWYGRKWGLC